jgi:hypothetical protein
MPCRAGITTKPEERRREWEQEEPTMRNWELSGPFSSRQAAQEWEDEQPCIKHGGGNEPDARGVQWWGYRFDYSD